MSLRNLWSIIHLFPDKQETMLNGNSLWARGKRLQWMLVPLERRENSKWRAYGDWEYGKSFLSLQKKTWHGDRRSGFNLYRKTHLSDSKYFVLENQHPRESLHLQWQWEGLPWSVLLQRTYDSSWWRRKSMEARKVMRHLLFHECMKKLAC